MPSPLNKVNPLLKSNSILSHKHTYRAFFRKSMHSLHKTKAGKFYLSCRQLPAPPSQHLIDAFKDTTAAGLCILGKWLKSLYNHGWEKPRKVNISNQCQAMASQSIKVTHTFFIFLLPSLLRGDPDFSFHGLQERPHQDQAPPEPQRSLSLTYCCQSLTTHSDGSRELRNHREMPRLSSMPRECI